jgi:signal transduction histidine kinase
MLLRTKTLAFMLLALIIIVASLYLTSRLTLIKGLNEIETNEVQMYAERAYAAFSQELTELERTAEDWSSRDDTYAFIEDGNQGYARTNLGDDRFVTLQVNMMLFVNSSGQLVYGKAFDFNLGKQASVPSNLLLTPSTVNLPAQGSMASGIILTKEGPMMIVQRPVLKSSQEGPARGSLIFGRYIDDNLAAEIAGITLTDLNLYSVNNLPPDSPPELLSSVNNSQILVRRIGEQNITAYTIMKDIYNKPALISQVTIPRKTYLLGQDYFILFIFLVLATLCLIGGLLAWLMYNQVLARIGVLIKGIEKIASTGDTSTRIDLKGKDELAVVAGTINGTLAVLQESESELRKMYQQEKDLRSNLEQEVERRAEYTRALVHELRTPLTPILAASELLVDEMKGSPMYSLATNIQRSATNLNRRVGELLDLARGEVGQIKLNIMPVNMERLLKDTTDEARSQAVLKNQTISLEIKSPLLPIMADEERLQQVMLNLLNNSIKFTQNGGKITVRAREEGKELTVEVEDNGRGISEEEQKRLFDPYHRRESDRDRLSGLGLGLAISKRFIELHGGKISAASTQGKGTTFTFSIPLKSVPDDDENETR